MNRMGLVDGVKEPKKVEMELWKLIPRTREAISATGWCFMDGMCAPPGRSPIVNDAAFLISVKKPEYKKRRPWN